VNRLPSSVRLLLLVVAAPAWLTACPNPPPTDDAGPPTTDAGVEADAGEPAADAGITPAVDAGADAGPTTPDDAGPSAPDAGVAADAGLVTSDAGAPADSGAEDAGTDDAGAVDAGADDAGAMDAGADDAGSTIDGGLPAPDAGTPVDAGTATADAGMPDDAGTTAPDAGMPDDAGKTAPDAGTSGACAPVSPCADVMPNDEVLFHVDANGTSVDVVNVGTLAIGSTTRATVEAVFGAIAPDPLTPYRGSLCGAGLALRFVDDKNGDDFDAAPSGGDVLARVVTLPLANASIVRAGQPQGEQGGDRVAALSAFEAASSVPHDDAAFDFDPSVGFGMRSSAGVIDQLSAYQPQDAARWALDFDFATLTVSAGASTFTAGEQPMAEADAVFGSSFDVDGVLDVAGVAMAVRTYASTGVRLADLCFLQQCNDVETIVLAPPFLGHDANGLGLGSTQADIEAVLGPPTGYDGDQADVDDRIHLYQGDDVGVLYVKDADCVKRAVVIVLGYVDAP